MKHEYLMLEDYYESRSVMKGRKEKRCEFCGKHIPIGSPATTHTFYPEYQAYDTCVGCEKGFRESLNTPEDLSKREQEHSAESKFANELQLVRDLIKE